MNSIPNLDQFINIKHTLPAVGTWHKSVHVFDERSAQAIRSALATGRPLLVRGDPGTGKSQLARAAAKVLGRNFLSFVVDAHTEVQDLWYRFDAVSRLGHAQVLSVTGAGKNIEEELDPQHYLSPGILWWAFAWETASTHPCKHSMYKPAVADRGDDSQGVVLLLDEIDKADADLPNSLLETLDNGKFTVPWLDHTVGVAADSQVPRPLVIITTNEDRQLPPAFVRRCLVLDLSLPQTEAGLIHFLEERAVFHFPEQNLATGDEQPLKRDKKQNLLSRSRFDKAVITQIAQQLYQDRLQAQTLGFTPPGQAEFLDVLRVLDELVPKDSVQQIKLLDTIHEFAFSKYPGMQKKQAPEQASENPEASEMD
jgi:MoxR-like ATPase